MSAQNLDNSSNPTSMKSAAQIVEERLRASWHSRIRDLTCEQRAGGLLLRGRVVSFYEKQLAQELLRDFVGTTSIFNDVDVVS